MHRYSLGIEKITINEIQDTRNPPPNQRMRYPILGYLPLGCRLMTMVYGASAINHGFKTTVFIQSTYFVCAAVYIP